MSLLEKIDKHSVPKHIAIIMDGNGRWAKSKGKARIFGHQSALDAVRASVEGCAEAGVKFLTLYAFSTENWNRPKLEVMALMELLVKAISNEVDRLNKNNIKLTAIGNISLLPSGAQRELKKAMEKTASNTHMTLTLALSYSSKWELLEAVKNISDDVRKGLFSPEDIDEEMFSSYLQTKNMPDPELMIRTSGEHRISNFLLWQLAYSELYFTPTLWPDFKKEDLFNAIIDFQNRERRFGLTSEQVAS